MIKRDDIPKLKQIKAPAPIVTNGAAPIVANGAAPIVANGAAPLILPVAIAPLILPVAIAALILPVAIAVSLAPAYFLAILESSATTKLTIKVFATPAGDTGTASTHQASFNLFYCSMSSTSSCFIFFLTRFNLFI
jgi:hypothetical protein